MEKCSKHIYASMREANQVINDFKRHFYTITGQRINRAKGKDAKKLKRSYYCESCEGWHITSAKKINKFK